MNFCIKLAHKNKLTSSNNRKKGEVELLMRGRRNSESHIKVQFIEVKHFKNREVQKQEKTFLHVYKLQS